MAKPIAHRLMRQTQILRGDSIQNNQQVVIRAQLYMIAGRNGSVQNYRGKILAVRRAQFIDEAVECCVNLVSHSISPATSSSCPGISPPLDRPTYRSSPSAPASRPRPAWSIAYLSI